MENVFHLQNARRHVDDSMKLRWLHCYASTHLRDSNKPTDDRVKNLYDVYNKLSKFYD